MDVDSLYNGSPHKFTTLSWDFVGSGTGNNFYGAGIYLADSYEEALHYGNEASAFRFLADGSELLEIPPVCQSYLDKFFKNNKFYDIIDNFSGGNSGTFNNKNIKQNWNLGKGLLPKLLDYCLENLRADIPKHIRKLERFKDSPEISDELATKINLKSKALVTLSKERENLNVSPDAEIVLRKNRYIYTVNVGEYDSEGKFNAVQQEELFYWEQPVPKEFIEKVSYKLPAGCCLDFDSKEVTGEQFYNKVASFFESPVKASEFLFDKCGIKGLKYKSTDEQEGHFNYVFFSDKILHVQKRSMYRKLGEDELEAERTLSKTECQDVIMDIQRRSNNGVQVEFVDNAEQLPDSIKNQRGFDTNIAGLANGNKVYFVLDNIKSREEAVNVWLHEVGQHQGVKNIIPNKEIRENIFSKVWDSARILAEDSSNKEIRKAVNQVRFNYNINEFSKAELGSEFLAHFSESALIKDKLNNTEKTFFSSIVSLIRNVVDRAFKINSKDILSERELTKLTINSIKSNFRSNNIGKEIKFKPEPLFVGRTRKERLSV